MTPARLGRYEIVRPLARGGMAELFLARATGIQRFEKLVVVKRILPEMAHDAEYVEMFLEEARLAAGLHHSNIVQVYDIGEEGGAPFFAMEYLHGEDVLGIVRAMRRRQERMPLEHALSIVIGVAAGLHHAHEQRDADGRPLGIVHRDVSPNNVAVTFDGGVKLLDFGVAKTRRRISVTRHGTLKGKLGYMSPEQCRGDELDRRSDVFAVAILMWELTTGRRLFGGRSDFGIMKSIAEADAPRPELVWPDCPAELSAIVMRGLRREREARFASAEELQLTLESFARERRLAVSGVGLGRWVRELMGKREARDDTAETTLYDAAAGDDDDAMATVVDGRLTTDAPSAPARKTRALAPRRRRSIAPLALAAMALAAVVGWRAAVALRVQPLAAPATSAPPASPPPPTITLATVPPPIRTASKPAQVKHARPARAKPRVDLDAPLPPK